MPDDKPPILSYRPDRGRRPSWFARLVARNGPAAGARIGAVLGGIVVPGIALIVCTMLFAGFGGPCFWPMVAAFGAFVGYGIGDAVGGGDRASEPTPALGR